MEEERKEIIEFIRYFLDDKDVQDILKMAELDVEILNCFMTIKATEFILNKKNKK